MESEGTTQSPQLCNCDLSVKTRPKALASLRGRKKHEQKAPQKNDGEGKFHEKRFSLMFFNLYVYRIIMLDIVIYQKINWSSFPQTERCNCLSRKRKHVKAQKRLWFANTEKAVETIAISHRGLNHIDRRVVILIYQQEEGADLIPSTAKAVIMDGNSRFSMELKTPIVEIVDQIGGRNYDDSH